MYYVISGDGRTRAWASLRIRDLHNDVGKCRSSIWVPDIVYFINSVQPATGLVLHGWAYYLWLGGHYGAGVYPRDVVSNRIYKLVMSSGH